MSEQTEYRQGDTEVVLLKKILNRLQLISGGGGGGGGNPDAGDLVGNTLASNVIFSSLTTAAGGVFGTAAYRAAGVANGVATLDAGGKIPTSQIPDAVLGQVEYQGTWNATTNTPTLSATPGAGTKGDYYVVSVAGTFAGLDFQVGDWAISNGATLQKVDNTDAVTMVAGRTGAIVLVQADIAGLTTASSPTFAGLTLSGATASTLAYFNGSKLLGSVTMGNSLALTGATLDTIQDIRTSASPTWTSPNFTGTPTFANTGFTVGATTPGSITGVSGAITVAAAGTNQNIVLVPSGTGTSAGKVLFNPGGTLSSGIGVNPGDAGYNCLWLGLPTATTKVDANCALQANGTNVYVNAAGVVGSVVFSVNGTAVASVGGSNGGFNIAGPIAGGAGQTLTGAGAVSIATLLTRYVSNGGAQALTLADGIDGQIKQITHSVAGGSGVLTPATKTGYGTITFTNAGDSVLLRFIGSGIGWVVTGSYGAVVA